MSYPTDSNLTPMLRKLSQIGQLSDKLRKRAGVILGEIAEALVGQQVIRYGRRYQIMQKPRVGNDGHLDCYGVPVNKKGKVGVRGYSLGHLEACEFVKPMSAYPCNECGKDCGGSCRNH